MRNLTTDFRAAIAQGTVPIGMLCEIDYPDTPLRAWTGPSTLSWDGKEWFGVGDFGGISAVQERAALEAPPLTVQLSGVPATNRANAVSDSSQRRRATVWLAAFSVSEEGVWSIVDAPWLVRRGYTDVHSGTIGAKTATIRCSIESPLARMRAASPVRLTNAEQQRLFPGDTGMRYAGKIGDKAIYWGSAAPSTTAAASGSNGGRPVYSR